VVVVPLKQKSIKHRHPETAEEKRNKHRNEKKTLKQKSINARNV
jgi:hypothetical protein